MKRKNLKAPRSEIVAELPIACASEAAAVAFMERKLWGDSPTCPECTSANVYPMKDRKTGERSKRFLWRCRECNRQYTVRTGTIYEDSLIPLHKWVRAFWEAAAGKNGVSALELSRKLEISYKSALFMAHRIRYAMAQDTTTPPKLDGTIEADETYVGGKPRYRGTAANPINKRGRGTSKQPVAGVLQRGGKVRTRVIARVNAENLRAMLHDNVDRSARLFTDGENAYTTVGPDYAVHESVDHGRREYARGEIHTNSIEGFWARVKRGITGVYHNVSREHLHRYMSHFEYMHNTRVMDDGQRTLDLLKQSKGKKLLYKEPVKKAG